jgi:hypothetical protein
MSSSLALSRAFAACAVEGTEETWDAGKNAVKDTAGETIEGSLWPGAGIFMRDQNSW